MSDPRGPRSGARFEDVRAPLALFVRGLLGRAVALHLAPPGTQRAFANEHGWFFPAAYPQHGSAGRRVYFAAAAHLAAHARHGAPRFARRALKPIAWVLVSLLEDARVERAMVGELPGLARLFRGFHVARPSEPTTFPALCARIARALSAPDYRDPHPLVAKARGLFTATEPPTAERCRSLGSLLGNDVGQLRLAFNAKEYAVEPAYRDDHRLLWEEEADSEIAEQLLEALQEETRAARAERERESGGRRDELEGERPGSSAAAQKPRVFTYPEYDYQIQESRPAFCTVLEQPSLQPDTRAQLAAPSLGAAAARLARRLRAASLAHKRRECDGHELDLDAAVRARIALRGRTTPDPRLYVRMAREREPVAVLLLLDVSQSTGAKIEGSGRTLLALEREACLVFGELLHRAGDRFAVHGFSSDGRERVEYHRFKELDERWDAQTRARLFTLSPRLSTRMGAAVRHATRILRDAPEQHRILLLLTDGEPADVDAPDPTQPYLLLDARRAVGEARRAGVRVFAISLEPSADRAVQAIFGAAHSRALSRLERLPELLSAVYARLAG